MLLPFMRVLLVSKAKPIFFAVAFLVLSSKIAVACSCVGVPSVAEAFGESKVVFSGTVIARLRYGVRFKVEKAWKGLSSDEIYIYTGNLRNSCDPWFEKGERWLVYAWDTQLYADEQSTAPISVELMAHGCHRNTLSENTAEDFKELGTGKPPVRRPKRVQGSVKHPLTTKHNKPCS